MRLRRRQGTRGVFSGVVHRKKAAELAHEARNRRRDGWKVVDIAKELQVPVQSVYNYLRQDAQDLDDKDWLAASALYHRVGLCTRALANLFGGALTLRGS